MKRTILRPLLEAAFLAMASTACEPAYRDAVSAGGARADLTAGTRGLAVPPRGARPGRCR